MASQHTQGTAFGFYDEDFTPEDCPDYPDSFCTLKVENLFPRAKFPMLCKESPITDNAYSLIKPALFLASQMITQRWKCLQIFVHRLPNDPTDDDWLDSDKELEISQHEVTSMLKSVMPEIEFSPDIEPNSGSFAQTSLRPDMPSDLIILDYNLIRLLNDKMSRDNQRLAALVILAISLCHQLAHILEFRCIRKGRLRPDGKPFETPPGITCREAGTCWETRAFGGQVYPVCTGKTSLLLLRGICIQSSAWNFDMMKLNEGWIRRLFSEDHWVTDPHPLRPPIDVCARHAVLGDELFESPLKKKARGSDVLVGKYSPKKRRRAVEGMKLCGGKRVMPDGT
ncbi:hypothetical protein FQN55_008235 [Onygenales sp. PD_40]|nr:hypothetical protein FQN55_008235 [Onygenales sp. PD_40]KAK2769505.1 hypothetical protein FQN53_006137 [Emmonsiellopsis sp. PD_33]KAK2785197.1 hypothetical protein FQN52_008533 [Onygenales sp. PD_12]KAK2797430.1 hypothetical protein FQN51_008462 [Onygenales sp. PD_10]